MNTGIHEVCFMADHMVTRLGKYLRILGYDAAWDERVRTHELIARANAEGRVFLTRNTHLADRYLRPDQLILLRETDAVVQLKTVVAELKLNPSRSLFSRCIRCNVRLEPIPDPETIRTRVHPNVFGRHQDFFSCPRCQAVFWKGSHVSNTCRRLGLPTGCI